MPEPVDKPKVSETLPESPKTTKDRLKELKQKIEAKQPTAAAEKKERLNKLLQDVTQAITMLEGGKEPTKEQVDQWEREFKELEKKSPEKVGMLSEFLKKFNEFQENLNMTSKDLKGLMDMLSQIPGLKMLAGLLMFLANSPVAKRKTIEAAGITIKAITDATPEVIKAREKNAVTQLESQANARRKNAQQRSPKEAENDVPPYSFEDHVDALAAALHDSATFAGTFPQFVAKHGNLSKGGGITLEQLVELGRELPPLPAAKPKPTPPPATPPATPPKTV